MCVCLSSLIKVPTESFLFFLLGEGLLVCLSAIVSNLTVNKPRALSDLPQKGCSFTFLPLHLIILVGSRINIDASFKRIFPGIHAVTCKALKTRSVVISLPWACKLSVTLQRATFHYASDPIALPSKPPLLLVSDYF